MKLSKDKPEFRIGANKFVEFAVNDYKIKHNINPKSKKKIKLLCPCTICVNRQTKITSETIREHLYHNGILESYKTWYLHGESDTPARIDESERNPSLNVDPMEFTAEPPPEVTEENRTTNAEEARHMLNTTKETFMGDPKKFEKLIIDAATPLYEGCSKHTKLSANIKLLNIKSRVGLSDKGFDYFLEAIQEFLPEKNELCKNTYEAKKSLKQMGSGYVKIHACINNCILYRKIYAKLKKCPKCGTTRWKVNPQNNKIIYNVPAKVLWYFPIIPRLIRLFQSEKTAKDMVWHEKERKKEPGVLRHPADSPAWAAIDKRYPDFGSEPRNIRLGISTDGVDVHRGTKTHSVWPILSVIYNLPPWLCMKRKFMMLSLLISGTPGNDIDVFLEPLIEDLQLLFDTGVETFDAFTKTKFNLRAVVLWTINDYPALGTLCGCPYSGFKGCVVCRKETHYDRLTYSKKQAYMGHRRYLRAGHAFRNQSIAFNGKPEHRMAPKIMTGEEIYEEVKHVKNNWGKEPQIIQTKTAAKSGKKRKRGEPKKDKEKNDEGPYWKKFNIWYKRLEYWRYNLVPNCLDFMHIEKNVAESIVGTLLSLPFKTKDGLNARKDMNDPDNLMVMKPLLHPIIEGDKTILPPAGFSLSDAEKDMFLKTLFHLRVPTGYCSNWSSLVLLNERKLQGLKSHDYHMLMQQFLPIAIRNIMLPATRSALIRFCFFFKSICSKEIKVDELDKLQEDLVETLCLLEKFFPLAFFDVMIHLTVHLTREVKLCGPIFFRWMYPFERCMKIIKDHVRSKSAPEGCIAEERVAEETIEFFGEFLKGLDTVGIPKDNYKTSEENVNGIHTTAGKMCEVGGEILEKVHFFVLHNRSEIAPYIK